MEILAPAGGPEQLIAAVRAGVNAVYLGLSSFSARGAAVNFNEEEFFRAVEYCHERDVRVYVALNILVKDSEEEAFYRQLRAVCRAGADAVIVQDLGMARLIREYAPGLPMHASTQMTVHNIAGAKMLKELGFRRVVPARELTLEEIRRLTAATELETEIFIHGALCMCASGKCYLSSLLGERSGNRGQCAQPCRLNFNCEGREYALSLKDLCALPHFAALEKAGVTSVKIEGRMKRPEYVAGATDACRVAASGKSPDLTALRAVFSRSGFTDGYLTGRRDLSMFGVRRKEDVTAAAGVLDELAGLYRKERQKIPVDLSLNVTAGTLTASDGAHCVTVRSAISPEKAKTAPTTEERARVAMAKTGDTPYYLRDFSFADTDSVLPVSALNALRREALTALGKQRSERAEIPIAPYAPLEKTRRENPRPALWLRFEKAGQVCCEGLAERIILPIGEIEKNPALIARLGEKLTGEMPTLFFDTAATEKRLAALKEQGLTHLTADDLGGIYLGRKLGFTVHGGVCLNLLNTRALAAAEEMGLADATVSFELSRERIRVLGGKIRRGVLVYGRLPLMRFRACPKNDCAHCGGAVTLTDRMGIAFPMLCTERKYQTLYNSLPLFAGDDFGVDHRLCYFTDEQDIPALVRAIVRGEKPDGRFTGGLYRRDII